jgi:hypothetical protein
MESLPSLITHPIALCAYIVSLAFATIAKKSGKRFFYLTAFISVVALIGGLFLAWQQINRTSSPVPVTTTNTTPSLDREQSPAAKPPASQVSGGEQSPNVSGVKGDVNITYGATGESSDSKKK